jgi:hypothetical protein
MTILVAVLIWVVAMLIAVPQLLYFTTEYNPGKERLFFQIKNQAAFALKKSNSKQPLLIGLYIL